MTRPTVVTTRLIGALAAGCGGSDGTSRTKGGSKATVKPQVLRVESTNAGSPEARQFAVRIDARSGGALRAEIRQNHPASVPANEARLARAVRAGEADFGILPARGWPAAGVPPFAALQAPFVLGDYDAARQAIAGPAGAALRDELDAVGVIPTRPGARTAAAHARGQTARDRGGLPRNASPHTDNTISAADLSDVARNPSRA